MKCPFDLTNKKQVIEFDEIDPYNPDNRLKGFINRRQGKLYGALWITEVNGEKCEQLIYSAPKQHYPHDRNDNWDFPDYEKIELYEKLDGTCIISYNYSDVYGNVYLTYKTRLRPFLGTGKYGNFFELWNEMRDKYSNIDYLCSISGCNYVFELYGKRNKILIDYDVPLDTKFIFFINATSGHIYTPNQFILYLKNIIPYNECMGTLKQITPESYDIHKQYLESVLDIDEDNKIMKGMEGYVMYFMKDNIATQIKCKPKSVLKYHWSGDAIPFESVYTTVINAFENFDEPTIDDINELLKEEFTMDKISKSYIRIKKCLEKVLFDKKYMHKLSKDYKEQGFNINKDKSTCMRWFAKHYPKSQATRIFNLLKRYEDET